MNKFLVVVIGSFFLVGLFVGWVLGYYASKYERPTGLVEEYDKGDSV